MQWLRFFLGTPQRALVTVGCAALVYFAAKPDALERAITGLLQAVVSAVTPFVEPLLTIAIIAVVVVWLFKLALGKKGGNKTSSTKPRAGIPARGLTFILSCAKLFLPIKRWSGSVATVQTCRLGNSSRPLDPTCG